MSAVKELAKKIIDKLPEKASWDDLMYRIYVQKKVETSLDAVKEGKTMEHDEVKKKVMEK